MATLNDFGPVYLLEKLRNESKELFKKLEALWHAVEPSIKNVVILFPEYTPHDVTHLQQLFRLSEKILGEEGLNKLNHTECFLLGAAIIAHDWGMGVSSVEQGAIMNGNNGPTKLTDAEENEYTQPLLPDEQRQLQEHQMFRGLKFSWDHRLQTLTDPDQLGA